MPYIAIEGFEHLKRYRKGDAIDDTLSPATLTAKRATIRPPMEAAWRMAPLR